MQLRHVVATAAVLAWLALPRPTLADCQPAGPIPNAIAQAPVVFVGTVVGAASGEGAPPVAIRVEEIWAGRVSPQVTVHGLTDDGGFVEDDRRWTVGTRYLVVPIVEANLLRDSICSTTTEWQPELAALRPVTVQSSATDVAVPLLPILAVAAFVAVLLAAFLGYDRYRRPPGP